MKALNQQELETWIPVLNEIVSEAIVQDVYCFASGLVIELYKKVPLFLILDLQQERPAVLIFEGGVDLKKTKDKPVGLFLKSNLRNLIVDEISLNQKMGRVIEINAHRKFSDEVRSCRLEFHLIPKKVNLLCQADKKKISWNKPEKIELALQNFSIDRVRTPAEIHEEWLQVIKSGKGSLVVDPKAQWEAQKQKDLVKKRKALEMIEKSIQSHTPDAWMDAGEYLKIYGNKNLPEKILPFVDLGQSISWNIENCFTQAKSAESKIRGARERQNLVAREIEALENSQYLQTPQNNSKKSVDALKVSDVKVRSLKLDSGAIAYVGKSAQDNLRLLRQAKAWDLWIHLKDYPGAHAIIRRNKSQNISIEEIEQVGRWVCLESLGGQRAAKIAICELIYVEVRFVRPIKGDRLGRVTYQSAKTLNIQVNGRK